jgi:hypothetical protein
MSQSSKESLKPEQKEKKSPNSMKISLHILELKKGKKGKRSYAPIGN